MSEQRIQTKILDYLKTLPDCWAVKTITTNRNGTPDILASIGGRFYAFEVKAPTGKPSAIQEVQIRRINETGGTAAIVRSVEDVIELLK